MREGSELVKADNLKAIFFALDNFVTSCKRL